MLLFAVFGFKIRNVWSLNLKDRWRLYRRWLVDVCESYRQTITLYQEEFEIGTRKLKEIKNLEDFEILKNADVVGLTTTGKFNSLVSRNASNRKHAQFSNKRHKV